MQCHLTPVLSFVAVVLPAHMTGRANTQLQSQLNIARQVFEDEYATVRSPDELPGARSAYRLPAELLNSIHEDLLKREASQVSSWKLRKIIIAGGRKHFSECMLESLSWATIKELKLSRIARGTEAKRS